MRVTLPFDRSIPLANPNEMSSFEYLGPQSVDHWCYEVPAGGLSAGLTPERSRPPRAPGRGRRHRSQPLPLAQFYNSNGISNEIAYVYLATGVELGESHPEPTELTEIRLVPLEEALRMARGGDISDGPSALALLWCERLLQNHLT
jgi:hypothetical protein